MNYFKMFKEFGIIDNDFNFFSISSFDIDNNCLKSSDALFELINDVYTENDFDLYLSGFIVQLKNLYIELGFNLGCLSIERHFKKEFSLNFRDTEKMGIKKILNFHGYIDVLFNRVGEILLNPDMEKFFSGLQRDLILENGVPEEAINFVLNSAELNKLIYFLIKASFKCGLLLYLVYKTRHSKII